MPSEFFTISDDLLVKHLLEETNPEERLLVEKWLAQKEEHRSYYAGLRLLLEKSGKVKLPYVDEEAAWQRFRQRIRQAPVPEALPVTHRKRSSFLWMKVAAIFVAVFAFSFLAVNLMKDEVPRLVALSSGERVLADTLPDGSVVTLNKNSSLSYQESFPGKAREVALSGEAFFSVKADRKKPFIIKVNDVTVRVVGTSFNIKSSSGRTEVIVETGVVEVISGNNRVELRHRESVTVEARDTVLQKEPVVDQLYNYYQSRQFVCDHTPLWKLVEVLNEAYGVNIQIAEKELRDLPLNATFNNESLDKILQVVATTLDLKVEREEGRILLR